MRQHQPPRSAVGHRRRSPLSVSSRLARPLCSHRLGAHVARRANFPGAGADINGCILVRNAFIILTILPRSSSVSTAGVLQIRSECLKEVHLVSGVRCVLAMGAACTIASVATPVVGAGDRGCNAIRSEVLRPGSNSRARLSVGDRLVFALRAEPSVKAIVELAEGSGSPRVLAQDKGDGSSSYEARTSGEVRFWFKTEGDGGGSATVLVRCTPAQAASASRRKLASEILAAKQSKVLVAPIEQPVDLGADNENLLPIPGGGERRAPNPTASTPFLWRIRVLAASAKALWDL